MSASLIRQSPGHGRDLSRSANRPQSRSVHDQVLSAASSRPRTLRGPVSELSTSSPRSRSFHAQSTITDKTRPRAGHIPAVSLHLNWPRSAFILTTSFPPCRQRASRIIHELSDWKTWCCHAATNARSVSTVLLRPRGYTPRALVASGIASTVASARGFRLRPGSGVTLRLRFARRSPPPPLPRSPTADRSVRADLGGSADMNP